MTSRCPAVGRPAAKDELDAFLELLCADEELVRTEFDAIVAAEWPRPSDRRVAVPGLHVGADGDPAPRRRRPSRGRPPVEQRPGVDAWARQRSPPRPC